MFLQVCYCSANDHANKLCDSADDFDIEVGKVHSSGVSCLLTDDRFTSAECRDQKYGGMRCYTNDLPQGLLAPSATKTVAQTLYEYVSADWFSTSVVEAGQDYCATQRTFGTEEGTLCLQSYLAQAS